MRLPDEHHDVERRELKLDQIRELTARHPLVGRTKIFADVREEVIDVRVEKRASDIGRRHGVGGEEADFFGDPSLLDDSFERLRGEAGQVRVVPAFLDPRERQLHAADVRQYVEMVLAEPFAEKASRAVKQWVARRENDGAAVAMRGDLANDTVEPRVKS